MHAIRYTSSVRQVVPPDRLERGDVVVADAVLALLLALHEDLSAPA